MSSTSATADLYRFIVSEVIGQVRETFVDEGVDPDVLDTLRQEWLNRLKMAGGPDLNAATMAIPHMSGGAATTSSSIGGAHRIAIQPLPNAKREVKPSHNFPQKNLRNLQTRMQQGPPHMTGVSVIQQPLQYGAGASLPIHMGAHLASSSADAGQPPGMFLIRSDNSFGGAGLQLNQQHALALLQSSSSQQPPTQSRSRPPQLDGADDDGMMRRHINADHIDQTRATTSSSSSHITFPRKKAIPPKRVRNSDATPQLDGGGDSDASENGDEEDMNNLDEDDDDESEIAEDTNVAQPTEDDEPLNSGDDEDSDEGGDALFNVPNVVICQFDKVSRTRNRWKFGFKDGLLDINNVDRAFHRASGEAEW